MHVETDAGEGLTDPVTVDLPPAGTYSGPAADAAMDVSRRVTVAYLASWREAIHK